MKTNKELVLEKYEIMIETLNLRELRKLGKQHKVSVVKKPNETGPK